MLCGLDCLRGQVTAKDVLQGLAEAKEDTNASIIVKSIRMPRMRRQGTDSTTKDPKQMKVHSTTGADSNGRVFAALVRCDTAQSKEAIKGKGPKDSSKVSATEHGSKGITNGAMRAFTRTILMG
jgi:hypothetical protein